MCCAARNLNPVDVQCRLAAILDPYVRHQVVRLDDESLLLEALQPPISRGIWDNVIKCNEIQLLWSTLAERLETRKSGKDWIPHPAEIGGPIKTVSRLKFALVWRLFSMCFSSCYVVLDRKD